MEFLKKYKVIIVIAIICLLVVAVFVIKQTVKNEENNWVSLNEDTKIQKREHEYKLYEFGMENCDACKYMSNIVENIKNEFKGRIDFEYIDVNRNAKLANKFRVSYVPLFVIVDKDDKVVKQKLGIIELNEFKEFIESVIGN